MGHGLLPTQSNLFLEVAARRHACWRYTHDTSSPDHPNRTEPAAQSRGAADQAALPASQTVSQAVALPCNSPEVTSISNYKTGAVPPYNPKPRAVQALKSYGLLSYPTVSGPNTVNVLCSQAQLL